MTFQMLFIKATATLSSILLTKTIWPAPLQIKKIAVWITALLRPKKLIMSE